VLPRQPFHQPADADFKTADRARRFKLKDLGGAVDGSGVGDRAAAQLSGAAVERDDAGVRVSPPKVSRDYGICSDPGQAGRSVLIARRLTGKPQNPTDQRR
jgi:hypothetical protein